ncbi:MAG TPA: hypothetical protein VM513_29805 [Kofleriaceae bacterium]|jgi:hypothetical protein|nr:hypothetical protein [Kofleriaceae bacterium]
MAAYRDDLEALTARHATLEAELAAKTREVADAARLLDDARARRTLPVLPNLRVASPCSADWSKMVGDERVRACGDCKKNVYNLSEMTRDEAEALILEKEGKLCVRYFQRADGTILLKDCAVGVRRKRRLRIMAAGAVTLLAGAGAAAYALRGDERREGREDIPVCLIDEGAAVHETNGEVEARMGEAAVHETKGEMVIQGGISADVLSHP